MRRMMKVQVRVAAGTAATASGQLPEIVQTGIQQLQPEAAYFVVEDGLRTSYFFLDVSDPSQIVALAEPLFQQFSAAITFTPAMNVDDLLAGLAQLPS
jgi:hypothetical protein